MHRYEEKRLQNARVSSEICNVVLETITGAVNSLLYVEQLLEVPRGDVKWQKIVIIKRLGIAKRGTGRAWPKASRLLAWELYWPLGRMSGKTPMRDGFD